MYGAFTPRKKVLVIDVGKAYPMPENLGNFKTNHALGAKYVFLAHKGITDLAIHIRRGKRL